MSAAMPQARISSVGGCDVRGCRSGIGILPFRLFADRGASSLSEDLWCRERFGMAFFSRVLREEKEEVDDDDEDDEDMADEEDERRLGGLPGDEGVEGIGLSDPWRAPLVGRVDRARFVAFLIIGGSESSSSSQYKSIIEEISSQEDMRDGLRRVGWRSGEQTEQSWS
jgi:hypothetical protein